MILQSSHIGGFVCPQCASEGVDEGREFDLCGFSSSLPYQANGVSPYPASHIHVECSDCSRRMALTLRGKMINRFLMNNFSLECTRVMKISANHIDTTSLDIAQKPHSIIKGLLAFGGRIAGEKSIKLGDHPTKVRDMIGRAGLYDDYKDLFHLFEAISKFTPDSVTSMLLLLSDVIVPGAPTFGTFPGWMVDETFCDLNDYEQT